MLCVIGDIVQDIVVWLEEEIRHATDTKSTITITRGGSAANVAAFAGPRTPTRFIGCVGDDLAGLALTRDLESLGVDVKMQVRGTTGTIVVQIDQSGERNMFPSRGASGMLQPIDQQWLADVSLLHLTAYSLEVEPTRSSAIAAAQAVRANGGKISFDISSVYTIESLGKQTYLKYMAEIAPDYISANRDEAELLELALNDEPGPGLEQFPQATLLARNGAEATRVFVGGQLQHVVPVEPATTIRDLTGAGDAFNAGFLASVANGETDLEASVLAAHRLARRVLVSPGATEPADVEPSDSDAEKAS
ncbi:carbohydrate kinase family protein [Corynebacterium cystitidis]|uniref:Ribokinase n=1 Tax=Corynebacterium cystitidis DSM 20524 TaxID=1121357 RepID=A0A1H9ULH9_9CORY|nr:carbohydrate kinase family protein [Corynebacterium cystitidis]WJY81020.1 2-dehydro-3-deoxygluconokinase [Corynebacterium cystitidis DSM 20524]SES10199.1 ribokinase [Corynebacterium cystitidis DSM 20524]SNV90643.1 ribokinase [Corynebacterium cystitidis]